jgi:hypothetical protein
VTCTDRHRPSVRQVARGPDSGRRISASEPLIHTRGISAPNGPKE